MNELMIKAKKIKCLICDVDGVLTNGSLFLDNFGNSLKVFNVQDGMGLKLLMNAGIKVSIITSSNLDVIDHRMKQLGIEVYFKGQAEKESAYHDLLTKFNLTDAECAYVGDDLPDLALIKRVGLGIAVANAVHEVREFADWQTTKNGGEGAVREICDLILHAQDKFDAALAEYFKHESR